MRRSYGISIIEINYGIMVGAWHHSRKRPVSLRLMVYDLDVETYPMVRDTMINFLFN
jgi:hypothetical protein